MAYAHSDAQKNALKALFGRYRDKIAASPDTFSSMPQRCHASSLIRLFDEAVSNMSQYPFDKLNRWLGFNEPPAPESKIADGVSTLRRGAGRLT